ncbi:MAG: AAA family ATPase, partial [Alloalcanivorax venustensis]
AEAFPDNSVLFCHNAQRHLEGHDSAPTAQQAWNLRDQFKRNYRMLVLVTPPGAKMPSEVAGDIVNITEELPGPDQLRGIVERIHRSVNLDIPEGDAMHSALAAVTGLTAFGAEQVTAMSVTAEGLDDEQLWERKYEEIDRCEGLTALRDRMGMSDLGGLEVIKRFLGLLLKGKDRPNCIVFIDEIEKMLAAGWGDSTGVSQDQLGTTLSWMQDQNAVGVLLVGHPGSGKSAVAKAAGRDAGVTTVQLDYGAMKGSLHGQSEQALRTALEVIRTISGGKTLWIATCNKLESLPPELRRRFKAGTFFFDLPTQDEREPIWAIHGEKYGVDTSEGSRPDCDGWTGAEIEQCCELAYRLEVSIKDAAEFVVPISVSASDAIENLRKQANNRWLSASYPGTYQIDKVEVATDGRAMSLDA